MCSAYSVLLSFPPTVSSSIKHTLHYMDIAASPKLRCLSSRALSGSADSTFDECFESMWHYNCVLSSSSVQKSLNSAVKASLAFSDCSRSERPPNDLRSEDQNPDLEEGFLSRPSTLRLLALFRTLDENNDGNVSVDELLCLLSKLGEEVSRSYLISLMEPFHNTANMAVSYAEFTALYQSIYSRELDTHTQEEKAQQIDAELDSGELLDTFNVYDKNGDGYICAAELAVVLRNLGFPEGTDLEKCQTLTLIDRVDTDGNGLVDLREFKEMLWRGCGISETTTTRSCACETMTQTPKPEFLFYEIGCGMESIAVC